jgi:hypothetical protein
MTMLRARSTYGAVDARTVGDYRTVEIPGIKDGATAGSH